MVTSTPDGKYFIRLDEGKALLSPQNIWECHMKTSNRFRPEL